MEAKAVLLSIRATPENAEQLLRDGVKDRECIAGLVTWIVAALDGVLIDPEAL